MFVVALSRRWNVSLIVLLTFLTCLSFLRMTVVQQQLTVVTRVFSSRCRFQIPPKSTEVGYCPPATNVFFLKTHKCASSTVQNILMRYGDTRNLSFLLPYRHNYIGHPTPFSISLLSADMTPTIGFNIFCHHTRFDGEQVRAVLPSDAIFVTILRHPVNLFESLYGYYEMEKHVGKTLEEFAMEEMSKEKLRLNRFVQRIGPNQMLFDMGYSEEDWSNDTRLHSDILRRVEKDFQLVLIAELFDESLILLKNRLCWNTEDIVYFAQNQRTRSTVLNLSNEVGEKLAEYNRADYVLYEYFREKMERAIDEFGRERMNAEVRNLRLWNKLWFDHCVNRVEVSGRASLSDNARTYSDNVYSFVLKQGARLADICYRLATAELPYTEKLRERQRKLVSADHRVSPCLLVDPEKSS